MMEKPLVIKREKPQYSSMDYEFLRDLGIRCVQRLSGKIWTDFNTHDPGITILEQLCFAITDLGFRTDFTMQDLLNARTVKGKGQPKNTFFDASEIFPTNPLTIEDYRILIIDRVPYVKNAWFEPVRDNYLGIQGLYKVLLQVDEQARKPEMLRRIKNEVLEVFNLHRNLGEDIELIEILEVEKVVVYADIEISSDAVAEEILATIQFNVNEYLNPSIKFYTVEELREEGLTVDEIFDGPVPKNGFIKKAELLPMRQEVYVSKIMEIITNVEGVRRITFFNVEKNDFSIEGDVITIEKGFYPVLDMDTLDERFNSSNYPMQFFRGALNYELDLNTANQLLYSQFARYKKGYEQKKLYNVREYPSILKRDEIIKYYSIQHTFPLTYGLNEYGLPNNSRPTRERVAAIKQLRAYLLPFEQIMANYLAQLGHIKELFSIDQEVDRTYYAQAPTDIPFFEEIFNVGIDQSDLGEESVAEYRRRITEKFTAEVEKITARFDPFIDRRNRFLDHLMARFSERFDTDFLLKVAASYLPNHLAEKAEHDLIKAKIRFLQNYVDISRNRGQAFNYFESDDKVWNVSGLEKRVCLLLNVAQDSNESLLRILDGKQPLADAPAFPDIIEFIAPDAFTEGILSPEHPLSGELSEELSKAPEGEDKESQDEKNRQEAVDKILEQLGQAEKNANSDFLEDHELPQDEKSGDDNFTAPKVVHSAADIHFDSRFVFRAPSRSQLLLELLSIGIFAYNYIILGEKEGGFGVYYKGNRNIGVYKIHHSSTRLEARQAIDKLIDYLHLINKYSEGFHLVEHVLMRPQSKDQHFFVLLSDRDEPMLRSYQLGDQLEQRYLTEDIPACGILPENYDILPYYGEEAQERILKTKRSEQQEQDDALYEEEVNPFDENTQKFLDKLQEGDPQPPKEEEAPAPTAEKTIIEYHLLLKDFYGRYIARAPFGFPTTEEAQFFANDVIDYIKSFSKGNVSIFDKIIFDVKPRVQANVADTFYSQEISVVMPNWTTRFQNSDFRALLKNSIAVNCPVHLHVNFFWIGVEEMADFERAYNEWLYERLALEPRQPLLDEKALALTELIGAYQRIMLEKRKKKG